MERAVRESDFVLIVCTPHYRRRSDGHLGGVGYEGDIMTAEVLTRRNERKFIPLFRSGNEFDDAAPTWLQGKHYLDFRGARYSPDRYQDLVRTLSGTWVSAPAVGEPQDKISATAPRGTHDRDLELPASHWIPRLNIFIGGGVEVCRTIDCEPILVDCGPMLISQEHTALVARRRGELISEKKPSELVGILSEMPHLGDNPVTLQVWSAEYAAVDVLDKLGSRPTMISGDALVVCTETEELILHRRDSKSRDYPGALHTFGGSYSPHYDRNSLVDTAKRET